MAFLKRNLRNFYTVFFDDGSCKIKFRNLNSQKVILKEYFNTVRPKDGDLFKSVNEYLKDAKKDKKSYVSVIDGSLKHSLVMENSDDLKDKLTQKIDKNIIAILDENKFQKYKENIEVNEFEYISPFKVLYFLYKNCKLGGVNLFLIKFHQTLAIMVASKDKVIDAKMISLEKSYEKMILENLDLDINSDEIFCAAIEDYLKEFYEKHDDFIEKIMVYGSVGPEIGYYIFTKVFIKTEVGMEDVIDFANKINIKENF